ncbi:collagen-binding protein [Anopheles sinensis]|uniref:Collagen-binding protein n=1 Tax=Anopheles sinensis TaxID=74873 RepID=A0A084VI77_ANOSI|nr:collagen-binding protein [Anopheles sinensis]
MVSILDYGTKSGHVDRVFPPRRSPTKVGLPLSFFSSSTEATLWSDGDTHNGNPISPKVPDAIEQRVNDVSVLRKPAAFGLVSSRKGKERGTNREEEV